ncbi:hypothetical protein BC567DRAFT_4192 [Phyllosticta citribraziliensis]
MKGQVSVGWLHFLLILLFIGSCVLVSRSSCLVCCIPVRRHHIGPGPSPLCQPSLELPQVPGVVTAPCRPVGRVESAARRSAAQRSASHRSAAATLFRSWRLTGGALAAARWCRDWCRREPTARS